MKPRPVTRQEAQRLILAHWATALQLARKVNLPVQLPDWDHLRNYEFEEDLAQVLGGEWVISEWCPFNGIFCEWRDHAPRDVLESTAEGFRQRRVELEADGRNVDYLIAQVLGDNRTDAR